MIIKKIVDRMNNSSNAAYIILKLTFILSCAVLTAAAAASLLGCDIHIVRQLYSLPQSFLLVGGLVSVIIEDMSS